MELIEAPPQLDDLLPRARRRDPAALAELYRILGPHVFGLASYLLPTREAAEDITSDLFLRLPRALAAYDGRIPLRNWILRVAANAAIDWLRRHTRESHLFDTTGRDTAEAPSTADTPLDALLTSERASAVRHAIRQLPSRYRVPLVLRFYGDLSYDEIAAQIGLDRPQTGVLLFRAKRELRRILEGNPL